MSQIKFNMAARLSLLLIPLLLLVPAAAFAEGPTTGSGTFTATITSATTVFSSGGYTLFHFSGPDVFTGAETGTGTFSVYLLVLPSGASFGAGTVICPCTVAGHAGILTSQFTNKGNPDGTGTGQVQVFGSGGLEGFQGHETFQYTSSATGFAGPYQVQYEFSSDD